MKIIVNGALGRMGKEVVRLIENSDAKHTVFEKVDIYNENGCKCIAEVKGKADCIIDFSSHLATAEVCAYAVKTGTPAVIASTGHTEEEKELIKRISEKVPVFFSANMSLGVAVLTELAKKAAEAMPDADIEIVETHHNRKADAPSGTALMLAGAIKQVREKANFVFGRNGQCKRQKDDIGIHAVRMGNIVGIHEVIVSTDTQTLTLKHEAHSRALFAEGAISAAEFLVTRGNGLYDMHSMLE